MMRYFYTFMALIAALIMPWWIYMPIIFLGIFFYPFYIEAVLLALLIDTLYAGGLHNGLIGTLFGLSAAFLVIFAQPLRGYFRFYA